MATYNIPNNLEPGEHTLKIEASSDGLTTSTTIPFTINELLEKPAARLVLDQDDLFAYNTVHIDGSTSYQTDGSIIKYEWSTGETTPAIDLKLEHEDTEISLTVTGEDSQTSTLTYPIVLAKNDTVLGENEVFKQNEKYSSYFADKLGKFEKDTPAIGKWAKINYGENYQINLRDSTRSKRIDSLSLNVKIPVRGSLQDTYYGNFGKIIFDNGYYITLSFKQYRNKKDTYITLYKNSSTIGSATVTVDNAGRSNWEELEFDLTISQKDKKIEFASGSNAPVSFNIEKCNDIGCIRSVEFLCPTGIGINYFNINGTGSYVLVNGVTISEIPQSAPIVTCVTDNPKEVEYGTVCTLTASANQFESSFLWSTGETTQSIKVTPKKTTEYSCTITNDSGVSGIGYVTQQVVPYAPYAIIGANGLKDGVLNAGISEMVIIRSDSYSPVDLGLTYKWYLDDDLISTNKNIRLMGKSGTVKLVIEDELGNIEETSIILELTDNPTRKNIDLKRMTVYDKAVKNYVDKHVIPKASLDDIEDLFD